METKWFFAHNGVQGGPVSDSELRHLAEEGKLIPADLVWKEGMANWVKASNVNGLFPPPQKTAASPPPIPASNQGETQSIVTSVLAPNNRAIVCYRAALGLAVLSALLPWSQADASSSFMGNSGSYSASVSGVSILWGSLTLISGIAGIVLSLMKPVTILKDKCRTGMAAFGAVIVIFAVIGLATAPSHLGRGTNYADSFGNHVSASVGAGLGVYLALVGGLVSAVIGYRKDWSQEG